MTDQEVGRWRCRKCGKAIVAAGPRAPGARHSGAFSGPCPWGCGSILNRSFRAIRSGDVQVYRAEEWDQRALSPAAAADWTA